MNAYRPNPKPARFIKVHERPGDQTSHLLFLIDCDRLVIRVPYKGTYHDHYLGELNERWKALFGQIAEGDASGAGHQIDTSAQVGGHSKEVA